MQDSKFPIYCDSTFFRLLNNDWPGGARRLRGRGGSDCKRSRHSDSCVVPEFSERPGRFDLQEPPYTKPLLRRKLAISLGKGVVNNHRVKTGKRETGKA